MQKAPNHSNEILRLKSLRSEKILDTLPEGKFDFISQIALEICGTSIALVSLVDENRQWFKSRIGLEASETERSLAFCSHAILQEQVFEVRDTLEDERFFDNPLVLSSPFIRFYAGAPIYGRMNLPLGTLCVIDQNPKTLSTYQKEKLIELAACVSEVIKTRTDMRNLEEELQIIENKKSLLCNAHKRIIAETKRIKSSAMNNR